jgi:hypothetical protein
VRTRGELGASSTTRSALGGTPPRQRHRPTHHHAGGAAAGGRGGSLSGPRAGRGRSALRQRAPLRISFRCELCLSRTTPTSHIASGTGNPPNLRIYDAPRPRQRGATSGVPHGTDGSTSSGATQPRGAGGSLGRPGGRGRGAADTCDATPTDHDQHTWSSHGHAMRTPRIAEIIHQIVYRIY